MQDSQKTRRYNSTHFVKVRFDTLYAAGSGLSNSHRNSKLGELGVKVLECVPEPMSGKLLSGWENLSGVAELVKFSYVKETRYKSGVAFTWE